MTLDRFFAERFAAVAGITWRDVYSGDRVAIEKATALGAPSGRFRLPDVSTEDLGVPGPHGVVPVRIYRSKAPIDPAPALIWMHGGAFQFGSLDMIEAHGVAAEIAHRARAVVISVDYRLAPEHQYPVPVDDCVSVVHWVAGSFGGLGIDSGLLAVGGASAGANLATATALRLRDEDGPKLRALCLAYPSLHLVTPPPTPEIEEACAVLPPLARFDAATREGFSRTYLGDAYDDPPPYAMPGIADLAGLPRTAIANAEHDDLRSSGELFARQLREHGVQVEAWTEAGMAHGYLDRIGDVDGAERTLHRFAAFLQRSSTSAAR